MNTQIDLRRLASLPFIAALMMLGGCDSAASKPCDNKHEFSLCPDKSLPVGTPGGECDPAPPFNKTSCPGARCYRDRCYDCGGANELCCKAGTACDVGMCADDPDIDEVDVCRTDCGGPGQACCPIGGTKGCRGGHKCVEGVCSGEDIQAACGGDTGYLVMAVNPQTGCLIDPFAVTADSEEDAINCAEATWPGYYWDEVFLQGSNPVQPVAFCEVDNPPIPGTVGSPQPIDHYSEELALACMMHQHCGSGACNWEVCS